MADFIVKTIDPDFKRLVETVKHVVLYSFSEGSWKRTYIEGPLYVYMRKREPFHYMIIVNKSEPIVNNFIEPITEGLELKLVNMFLIYSKVGGTTHGICFCEEQHMLRIASVLATLISQAYDDKYKKFREPPRETREVHKASPTVLTKPQGKCSHTMVNIAKGSSKICTAKENSTTPQNVLDFFTNARSVSKVICPGMSIRAYEYTIQKLKSDPIYSLEYVENQQTNEVIRNEQIARSSSGSGLQPKPRPLLARKLPTHPIDIPPIRKIDYSKLWPSFPGLCDTTPPVMVMSPRGIPPVEDELGATWSSNVAPNLVQSQQFSNPVYTHQFFSTVNNAQGATIDAGALNDVIIGMLLKRLFKK